MRTYKLKAKNGTNEITFRAQNALDMLRQFSTCTADDYDFSPYQDELSPHLAVVVNEGLAYVRGCKSAPILHISEEDVPCDLMADCEFIEHDSNNSTMIWPPTSEEVQKEIDSLFEENN